MKEPTPSPLYGTFWYFAAERQAVYYRKLEGHQPPWTNDQILGEFRFTNPYRAADRVSQFLIRHVIYEGDQEPREVLFRTLLFKFFNRIDTWNTLQCKLGHICTASYSRRRYQRALECRLHNDQPIFSAAYIIPPPSGPFGTKRKHIAYLALLERMMNDNLHERLAQASSMSHAYQLLMRYPMIGPFLAYQLVTDLNYADWLRFSEMEFVSPGPGASDGIRKCFNDFGSLSEADVIRWVTERQEHEFRKRDLTFQDLWGRPLQLIDCQNLFCEVGKYTRISHPNARGTSGRTRIKQRYSPSPDPLPLPWFPPKWGINKAITTDSRIHQS